MDTIKRSPLDRLLFATFLKGRTSSREILNEKGEISPKKTRRSRKKPTKFSTMIPPILLSDTCLICLQNPNPPMMLSRSYMTASTRLLPH